MKLLIDLGNTRLKACAHGESLQLVGEVVDNHTLAVWLERNATSITVVAIASVAARESYQLVSSTLKSYLPSIQVFRLQYDAGLLATSYEFPEQLGIDRWLALLPFAKRGEAVVIDAGTACTIDVLRNGKHQGGYILPGLRLQRDVLAQQTAAVSFPRSQLGEVRLGLSTGECVSHGSLRALVALANDVGEEFGQTVERGSQYITGGDAPYFEGHLEAEKRPLLVFEGMLIALGHLIEGNK